MTLRKERGVRASAPLVGLVLALLLSACQSSTASSSFTPSSAAVSPSPAAAGPSATPASTASSTAAPLPSAIRRPTDIPIDGTCETGETCLGLLAAGVHHTQVFKPGFAFTMAASGWENLSQTGGVFSLLPIDSPGDGIWFFRQPKATAPDGTPVFSVDISVDAIKAWLATNKALSVGPVTQASVGGLKGVWMDLAIPATASPGGSAGCSSVQVCVSIFKGVDPSAIKTWTWDWGTASPERQRLYLLTATDGVIAIFVDSFDPTTFDALNKAADTILATVRFDKP